MVRSLVIVLAVATLPACYGPSIQIAHRRTVLADGLPAYRIVCDGAGHYCHKRARYLCPVGYRLLYEKQWVDGSSTRTTVVPLGYISVGMSETEVYHASRLLIRCADAAPPAPTAPGPPKVHSAADCQRSEWCRQLGRCRYQAGRCVR